MKVGKFYKIKKEKVSIFFTRFQEYDCYHIWYKRKKEAQHWMKLCNGGLSEHLFYLGQNSHKHHCFLTEGVKILVIFEGGKPAHFLEETD